MPSVGSVRYQHVYQHHWEDNGPRDRSSVRTFRRDDLAHYCAYLHKCFLANHAVLSLGYWLEKAPRHATTAALVLLRNVAFYAFVAWLLGHGGAFIYVLLPAVYTSRKVCCRVTAAWLPRNRRVTGAWPQRGRRVAAA